MKKRLLAIVLAVMLVLTTGGVALAHDQEDGEDSDARLVAAWGEEARAQGDEGTGVAEVEDGEETEVAEMEDGEETEAENDGEEGVEEEEQDEEEDEERDSGNEVELEGAIEALTSTTITVNGKVLLVNGGTEVEGTLAPGVMVEVEAVGQNGTLVAKEIEVEEDAATPPAPVTVPGAPSALSASAESATRVNLSWTDNSNNESGFHVQRAADSGFSTGLVTFSVAANVTTYSDTTVAAGTTYYYRVTAYNSAGDSAATTASVTTPSAPPTVTIPTGPTGLTAAASSATQVNLSWSDNSNNETGFHVQRATNGGFSVGLATFSVAANVTTYSDMTVTAGTTYYYRVTAYNSAGDSAASSTSVATPTAIDAAQLYASNCAVCHGANRQGGVGPALTPTSLASRTVSWIAAYIAGHRSGYTTEEYNALADWLKNTPP